MDPRSIRTRQWIRESLILLMGKMPYEKINIKEITEKASIARPTFYMHFSAKDDVLLDHLREINAAYMRQLRQAVAQGDYTPTLPATLAYESWKKEAAFIRLLKDAECLDLLYIALEESISGTLEYLSSNGLMERLPHEAHRLAQNYLLGAHGMMLVRWIQADCDPAPEVMAAFHMQMLSSLRKEDQKTFSPLRGFRFYRKPDESPV